jgi:hypothetical protein
VQADTSIVSHVIGCAAPASARAVGLRQTRARTHRVNAASLARTRTTLLHVAKQFGGEKPLLHVHVLAPVHVPPLPRTLQLYLRPARALSAQHANRCGTHLGSHVNCSQYCPEKPALHTQLPNEHVPAGDVTLPPPQSTSVKQFCSDIIAIVAFSMLMSGVGAGVTHTEQMPLIHCMPAELQLYRPVLLVAEIVSPHVVDRSAHVPLSSHVLHCEPVPPHAWPVRGLHTPL